MSYEDVPSNEALTKQVIASYSMPKYMHELNRKPSEVLERRAKPIFRISKEHTKKLTVLPSGSRGQRPTYPYPKPTRADRDKHEDAKKELSEWPRVARKMSPSVKQHGIPTSRETRLVQYTLRLMRIRDFLHLMLSYPMRIGYEDFLKQWINDVYPLWVMQLLIIFGDDDTDFDNLRRRFEQCLSESPLRYVQVIISQNITKKIKNGGSISRETPLKHVPQPILLSATHLALHQLTLTLTSDDKIQNIWFSTRNDAEKRTVEENIRANSRICAAFEDLQIIDLNQIDEEEEKGELELFKLPRRLEGTTSAESPAKNHRRSRHLVLVVDGDGHKNLDPQNVWSPIRRDSGDVVVFITTLSLARQNYELIKKVDLGIKTEDHLLPWEVFCRNVGSELLHTSIAIQEIAVQIVEQCGGHLLAILLMAKSLKGVKNVQIWELALQRLRYHNREAIVNAFFNIIGGNVISEREKAHLIRCLMVFKFLDWKVSDAQLFAHWFSKRLVGTKEEAKGILQNFMERSILLQFKDILDYILLPQDIKIILHTLGEEIPKNLSEGALESTISDLQVLNLSNTHMRSLYDVNTLLGPKELNLDGCKLQTLPRAIFKIQKLETLSLEHCSQLLELPQQISKLGNLKTLRLAGCRRLKTLPREIWELQNLEVCDLSGTQITCLPQFLNLPKLRSSLLGNNLNLMKIPSSFFDHVPFLSILNLSGTSIHELPSSIFNLQELRELYLKDCELFVELPRKISQLTNLTTLDLDGTLITHLPEEIRELSNLESLSLSFYNDSYFAVIPLGVLSKLNHLKVLRIGVNPDNGWWSENVGHILTEINGLQMLRELDMYIPRDNFLNRTERCLSNFRFIIGHHKPRMISHVPPIIEAMFKESSPSLKFVNGLVFPDEVKSILSKAWAFFLVCHMTINNLAEFGLKNLKQLRLCILAECNEMQSIVDVDEYGEDSDLNESFCMQVLTIFYMKNLRSIINKPVLSKSIFCKLKLLALHTCPELTTIFTMHSLHSLVNLEEVIVEDCPKVSSIITCPSLERTADFFLPRLRKLSLVFLPELACISKGVRIGRNLEHMGLYCCPKLQSLSTAELSSEKLKVIRGETEWWEALKWNEAEWGQEDRPHKFNQIFSPIDEDLDILTQLTSYELTSFNRENDSGGIEGEPLQSSSGKVSKDMRSITTGEIVGEPLESSRSIVSKYRRRTKETWTKISESLEDGYSWRKHRTRFIGDAKFPREYFCCTHGHDQDCKATKEVQRIEEKSFLYKIAYIGRHTCTQACIVADSSMNHQGGQMTQFGVDDSNNNPGKSTALWPSSSRIIADQKQIGSSRRSDTCTQACVTNSTLTDSVNQTGESASHADLELFFSDFWTELFVNKTHDSVSTQILSIYDL